MNAASFSYSLDVAGSAGTLRGFAIAANRPVQFALLLSALLHAIALGWLPGLERLTTATPSPLRILLPPPLPEARPVAVVPTPTAPLPAMRSFAAPAPSLSAPLTAQAMAVAPRADETPVARIAVPVERAVAPPMEAPSQPAATSVPAAIDVQALAGYGRSVAGAVAAHQRYPKIAQMRQWQGTTMLQLEFAADGRLLETRVLSSSGHDVLDRQALDMVRAAQPLPPLPAALAGRALTVNVPVVFRLAG